MNDVYAISIKKKSKKKKMHNIEEEGFQLSGSCDGDGSSVGTLTKKIFYGFPVLDAVRLWLLG